MFQFLDSTWSSVGGSKTDDPSLQAQYGLKYIQQRYGTPEAAWSFWQGHNWYAAGGPTPHGSGPLPDGGYPAVVHPGEFMISKRGRATVSDAFLHQLNAGQLRGFAPGGPIPEAIVPGPTPRPNFTPTTTAHTMVPPTPPTSVAPRQPAAPAAPSPAPASIGSAATQAQAPGQVYGGNANVAPAPSNLNHNLPAISQGIASTASVLGNLASQAVGAGMASAGLPGGAQAGQFVDGLIKEGGKIVDDAVNVGSSFLVGSVPGSTGTQDRAFGQTVFPQQNAPVTAPLRGASMTFNGISDVDRVMQEMNLRDAQSRAGLAHYGG